MLIITIQAKYRLFVIFILLSNKINLFSKIDINLIGLHTLDLEDIKSYQFKKLVFKNPVRFVALRLISGMTEKKPRNIN